MTEGTEEMKTATTSVDDVYGEITELLQAAAAKLQVMFPRNEDGKMHPAMQKALSMAVTKLEECHMWIGNGYAFLAQLGTAEEVAEEAIAKGNLEILPGGKTDG